MDGKATPVFGENCVIGKNVRFGENVIIRNNCIIEDDVFIGSNTYIDNNTIIYSGVSLGNDSNVGANCVLGEHLMDFYENRQNHGHTLNIGDRALLRSGTIVYGASDIGVDFQSGHNVTIREKTKIGDNVSIGTLSDVQGNCKIGNYVRLHSNVHIGQLSCIDDFVWIYPYVILTNDPTPPSENFVGVHVKSFAIVATGSVIMPGVCIGLDSLVGAGAVVTRDVPEYAVVVGNPAKQISDIRNVKNKITGEPAYPWRNHFNRAMPWEDSGFDEWYEALDFKSIEYHNLEYLQTEDS